MQFPPRVLRACCASLQVSKQLLERHLEMEDQALAGLLFRIAGELNPLLNFSVLSVAGQHQNPPLSREMAQNMLPPLAVKGPRNALYGGKLGGREDTRLR